MGLLSEDLISRDGTKSEGFNFGGILELLGGDLSSNCFIVFSVYKRGTKLIHFTIVPGTNFGIYLHTFLLFFYLGLLLYLLPMPLFVHCNKRLYFRFDIFQPPSHLFPARNLDISSKNILPSKIQFV